MGIQMAKINAVKIMGPFASCIGRQMSPLYSLTQILMESSPLQITFDGPIVLHQIAP